MTEGTFTHGVASGDPLTDRVVIWTRVSGSGEVPVRWILARDAALEDLVAAGEATASAARDYTVHVDVEGLEAATTYHYGFEANGERSPVGRTRTLSAGPERVRFAMCSCAKFNAGFFNAYARIAERDDLDFVLHLGDYIYEASNKPPKTQTPGADIGRPFEPGGECRTLADYRTRYAQYRRDPDVQALHAAHPVIATLDDHELADGAWAGGADAHDPKEHGPWQVRRDEALQARWEWLPARPPSDDPTRVFRAITFGALARLYLLDVRSRRDKPALGPEMSNPSRSMLGAEQREWLFDGLTESAPGWTIVASPSILNRTWLHRPEPALHDALLKLKLIDEDGEGPDEDQWDGYPAERSELLRRLLAVQDAVVLSGDIHVAVAGEVRHDGDPVTVEITTPSLTSQNLDEKLGSDAGSAEVGKAEDAFIAAFDHIEWCEFASHGYVVIDLDAERLRTEWWFVDGVLERGGGESLGAAFEVPRGTTRLVAAGPAAR